jgi:hypothetical protein
MLVKNVENPIEKLVCTETPCAKTVQGDTPRFDLIKRASPVPNIHNPNTRINIVEGFALQ